MHLFYRIYQIILKSVSKLLKWKKQVLIEGAHVIEELYVTLDQRPEQKFIIVTDQGMVKAGLLDQLLSALKKSSKSFVVFDQITPNPTIESIEKAYAFYLESKCDAIIGFGGGSPMDAAKALGVKAVHPKKSLNKFQGILKVRKKLPYLVAIPTTAGTGSETTIAAVVTDQNTHIKYAIMDLNLMPDVAVLDPTLLVKLPPFFTATTGMDALTHAIEAFIGRSNTKATKKAALDAIQGIHQSLVQSYEHPDDLKARMDMLKASFLAGYAFTRAYVGNIHAIAHTYGGFYNVPHGYANAIIMPHVLTFYGKRVHHKLTIIYDHICLGDPTLSKAQKSTKVIEWIESLNQKMGIPKYIEIKEFKHLEQMAKRAHKEANPLYPVPKILKVEDFKSLLNNITC